MSLSHILSGTFIFTNPNKSLSMKKRFLLYSLLITLPFFKVSAQTDTTQIVTARDTAWKKGALLNITLGQTYLSDNWAAGGEPSYSLNGRANLFANYELGKVMWQNKLDMAFGFTEQKTTGFRKNDDFFEFTSNLGYKAAKKWYYSLVFSTKSQFYEGLKYTDTDTTTISDFLSPLYLNIAPGMTYKHNPHFQVFLSPLNARFTYVNDTAFASINSIDPGKHWRNELGFIAKANYKRDFSENVALLSNLDIFFDYLDPKAPSVSWEVLINFKVFKVLSVNFNTLLVYDENVLEEVSPGEFKSVGLQFKEVFGAGLALNF